MIERGLVVAGAVVPGTELVQRHPRAWWSWAASADRPDLRLRKGAPIELLGGHWTGGPIREGEDAAVRTVAAMRARQRDDGSLMDVSCHFVIGWDGGVWQVADVAVGTVHMGRAVNPRSIGVETTWPGYASQAVAIRGAIASKGRQPHAGYSGPVDVRTVRGRQVECLRPSAELVASWVALAELLADLSARRPELGLRIPRRLAVAGPGALAGEGRPRALAGAQGSEGRRRRLPRRGARARGVGAVGLAYRSAVCLPDGVRAAKGS